LSKNYELNVDVRILELLGPNLYTNIYYVLAELIANAYDADAQNVYIVEREGEIRVEDDGRGMSYRTGEVDNYLNVAGVSRQTDDEAKTPRGRLKMGRKGVGKLAALSVSEDVDVLTVSSGERSGFVLTRHPAADRMLREIPDEDITFDHVTDHGSAIVMREPEYSLHKTPAAIARNLLKMFPTVSKSFRVHVRVPGGSIVLDSFDESVMSELSTLRTLGVRYEHLTKLVSDPFPDRRRELVTSEPSHVVPLRMKNNSGEEKDYDLIVEGWIGTYKSTRGRKAERTDFPDNFISLFANGKLGEFNILPSVGQNKLSEVYIVGQLHVDLFELTELPDMALSNRQGYKSDDLRYDAVMEFVRDELLSKVRRRRDLYVNLDSREKKERQRLQRLNNEQKLRVSVDVFRSKTSSSVADALNITGQESSREAIRRVIEEEMNRFSPDLGLKALVDAQKKKVLISQTLKDKPFADAVYSMMIFNNIPKEEVLYTNADDEECRIPEGRSVYQYLREFFVDSYSTEKMLVVFVTSSNTKDSWGAISEVGASWITQVDHKIFNIHPFRPEHPLNDEAQWQSSNRDEVSSELYVTELNADIFCQKIEAIASSLGFAHKTRAQNRAYLGTLISVRKN
jgi:hypothetical protein